MEMAKYIISILKTNIPVIFSWGFNSPVALENGLRFNVNGFKHKGKVAVLYNEGLDLFNVEILTSGNDVIETITDLYFDQLIEIIDYRVEMVVNYNESVRAEYSKTSTENL